MSQALISVENVSKVFSVGGGVFGKKKSICAVDDVSFQINEGETVALVGESGCGKSTLGRLTLGILQPTSGRILFRGRDIWRLNRSEFKEFRRNAQIIHQDPYDTLNPMRTIYQSLSPPLLHYKIVRNRKECWEKASDLLEMVGLAPPEDFLQRYPARLSGGQMQRIAIARAISVNPSFIVADEAVSMLDASLRIEILDLLLDLKRKFNMACLFITHDFGVARYFARDGRILVMYLGSIVEVGPTEDVILDPIHPYTKILLDCVPIPDPKIARSKGIPYIKSLEIPSLTNVPVGCKFRTRCPYEKDVCSQKKPELKPAGRERFVACHMFS
ncbi:MAG: ABC transporter ATP-binding protein [Candidatus Bathyarchaeia archaeon]